jgi:hypothetical protein
MRGRASPSSCPLTCRLLICRLLRGHLSRPRCGRASPFSSPLVCRCLAGSSAGPLQPPHVRSRIAVLLSLNCRLLRGRLPGCLSRPTYGHALPFPTLPFGLPLPRGLFCRAASAAPRAVTHRRPPLCSRAVLWPALLPGCLSHPSGCHGSPPSCSCFWRLRSGGAWAGEGQL